MIVQEQSVNTLSVSIVYYKSPLEELSELLHSVSISIRKTPNLVAKVYLVDNSKDSEFSISEISHHVKELEDEGVELELIHGHGNVGFGRGHNLALQASTSDLHIILNPDVVLDEDCLRIGLAYLNSQEEVVIASPYAQNTDSSKQHLCKQYPSVLTFLIRGFLPRFLRSIFSKRLAKYEMHSLSEDEPTIGIPIVSGCFMMCRTAALREIGGFDEKYFLYFEDFDLSLRAQKIGKLAYVPSMRIRHAGGNAAKKGFSHLGMFAKSGFRFFNTHGWRFFRQSG